jgi:hypothetical protein
VKIEQITTCLIVCCTKRVIFVQFSRLGHFVDLVKVSDTIVMINLCCNGFYLVNNVTTNSVSNMAQRKRAGLITRRTVSQLGSTHTRHILTCYSARSKRGVASIIAFVFAIFRAASTTTWRFTLLCAKAGIADWGALSKDDSVTQKSTQTSRVFWDLIHLSDRACRKTSLSTQGSDGCKRTTHNERVRTVTWCH